MQTKDTHTYAGALEVAAHLADAHISSELVEMKRRQDMERAIRELDALGCPIDDISAATGWTPTDIRRSLGRDTHGFDLDRIAGNR